MRCFAIGYQGRSLAAMCELLANRGVELLVDVRERAWSNRPEFRKTALATALAEHGVEYLHTREAGNPFRPRAGETIDARDCMKQYRGYLKSKPSVIQEMLLLVRRQRVAVLCYEAMAEECHRGVLLEELKKARPSLAIVHL